MKLAIIGSKNADQEIATGYLTEVLSVMLLGQDTTQLQIGTFLNGPIHRRAAELASDFQSRLIRFHSIGAVIRWKPDLVMIFWDGRSIGCQACYDALTRGEIFTQVWLANPLTRRYLGTNNPRSVPTSPMHPRAVEFGAAGER